MSSLNNELTATSFQKSHPLDFNLFDDDDQQVMYIADSPEGHNLHIEIHNTSRYSVDILPPTSDAVSKDNCHFELRFRPGTLLAAALPVLALDKVALGDAPADAGQWRSGQEKHADGTISLYFLAAGKSPALVIAPDSSLKLTIKNITADGRGGARGTRVELKYRQMTYTGTDNPVKGLGVNHLSIVNEQGKKNIPLHFGFVGSDTILNNGMTVNDRIIKITNTLPDDKISLSAGSDAASKFILSFDVYEDRQQNAWALARKDSASAILVTELDGKGDPVTSPSWKIEPPTSQQQTPEWIITPLAGKTFLNPNESVQFKLSNIKSDLRSGAANVYLRYENLPGYWDGQFIASLEKSSLVERDQFDGSGIYTNKSYIGIGTALPAGPLSISENIGTAANPNSGTLVIDHENSGGASSLVFRSKVNRGSDYGYIQFQDADKVGDSGEESRLIIGIENDGGDHLILKPSGNIGAGTNQPLGKLHVVAPGGFGGEDGNGISQKGNVPIVAQSNSTAFGIINGSGRQAFALNINDDGGTSAERGVPTFHDKYDGNWHQCLSLKNGNVGIGTTDINTRLDVNGAANIWAGERYAAKANMAPGSLTVGSTSSNFGGGNGWNSNIAALLLETSDNTEVAVHDSQTRIASLMYYDGGNNRISIGRDMGWGTIGTLALNGNVGIGTPSPGAKLEVAGDAKVGRIIIGDWTLEARQDGAWGSANSALFITWKGKDIARFGTFRDMLQIRRFDGNGNYRGYCYMNEDGNIGSAG